MKSKDTKFKYGDKVKVIRGFNRGLIGRVYWHTPSGNYYNIYGNFSNFHEDNLELHIPWWKRLFNRDCSYGCYYS